MLNETYQAMVRDLFQDSIDLDHRPTHIQKRHRDFCLLTHLANRIALGDTTATRQAAENPHFNDWCDYARMIASRAEMQSAAAAMIAEAQAVRNAL